MLLREARCTPEATPRALRGVESLLSSGPGPAGRYGRIASDLIGASSPDSSSLQVDIIPNATRAATEGNSRFQIPNSRSWILKLSYYGIWNPESQHGVP